MSKAPIKMRWHGDGLIPTGAYWQKRADETLVIGQDYMIVEAHERSHNSHAHYFASIHEAWNSLPDHLAQRFPTDEHLRKYALIKAGYADHQTFVCSSAAEARRLMAFLMPIDEFSIVTATAATVTRHTAKSQNYRAMGKEDFQRSKDAVLSVIADIIGTSAADLSEAGKKAA